MVSFRGLTVSAQGGFVVQMVPQDGHGLVEQLGDLGVRFVFEKLLEELGIVAAAGGDELLLDGGALVGLRLALEKQR